MLDNTYASGYHVDQLRAVIEAALAEARKAFPHCDKCGSSAWMCSVCHPKAEPVPEPVAWRWSESDGQHWFAWTAKWDNHERAKELGCLIEYAHPPKAEPAPELTDALTELVACCTEPAGWDVGMLADRHRLNEMFARSNDRLEAALTNSRAVLKAQKEKT